MDTEKYWSATEMNKFLYQQLKAMCEANGFVLSPRKGKRLVRVAEHFTEVVYPEISYGRTVIHVLLFPSASFADHCYADKKIHLRRTNEENVFINSYDELAVEDPASFKRFFNIEQMKTVWAEVIRPQLDKDIFSCLATFDYNCFLILSDQEKYGGFHCLSSPGDYDAPRFFVMGCGELRAGNPEKSIPLLEQAFVRYQNGLDQSRRVGHEAAPYMREDRDTVAKLLSALKEDRVDGQKQVLDILRKSEQIALNRTWGVALSLEGKTVRLKKKELL